jgi:hypothetical protein
LTPSPGATTSDWVPRAERGDGTRERHPRPRLVGIAVGLLLASLHQAGLATLTHTPSPMRWLNDILGRPAEERAFVVVPVGYAAEGATVPDIDRKPLDKVLIHLGGTEGGNLDVQSGTPATFRGQ